MCLFVLPYFLIPAFQFLDLFLFLLFCLFLLRRSLLLGILLRRLFAVTRFTFLPRLALTLSFNRLLGFGFLAPGIIQVYR